jgi:hypothetical protein
MVWVGTVGFYLYYNPRDQRSRKDTVVEEILFFSVSKSRTRNGRVEVNVEYLAAIYDADDEQHYVLQRRSDDRPFETKTDSGRAADVAMKAWEQGDADPNLDWPVEEGGDLPQGVIEAYEASLAAIDVERERIGESPLNWKLATPEESAKAEKRRSSTSRRRESASRRRDRQMGRVSRQAPAEEVPSEQLSELMAAVKAAEQRAADAESRLSTFLVEQEKREMEARHLEVVTKLEAQVEALTAALSRQSASQVDPEVLAEAEAGEQVAAEG